MLIPKIIHQTCPDKNKLDPRFLENIAHIKRINPDWEYRLYDHEDRREFLSYNYPPKYLKAYDALQSDYGAAKADFFRYLLIYKYGGVYLDIKSGTTISLSEVINEDDVYILSEWDNHQDGEFPGAGRWSRYGVPSEFQQWHVIAVPEHPFLKTVISIVMENIENYDPFKLGHGRIGVLRTTGPIPYTLAIKPIQKLHDHRVVKIKDLGIEYSFFKNDINAHRLFIGSSYATSKQTLVKVTLLKMVTYKAFIYIKHFFKFIEKITIRPLVRKLKAVLNIFI